MTLSECGSMTHSNFMQSYRLPNLVADVTGSATFQDWAASLLPWMVVLFSLWTFCGHTASLSSAVFLLDKTFILTSCLDSNTKLWDIKSGQCIKSFSCHAGPVICAIFSFDSTCVISGGCDGTCTVCDILSGRCLLTLCKTQSSVTTTYIVLAPHRA